MWTSHLTQDRDQWWAVVHMARIVECYINGRFFLKYLSIYWLLRKKLTVWSSLDTTLL
jgi:hypothetical protein